MKIHQSIKILIFLTIVTPCAAALAQYCMIIYTGLGQETEIIFPDNQFSTRHCPSNAVAVGFRYDGLGDNHIDRTYCRELINIP